MEELTMYEMEELEGGAFPVVLIYVVVGVGLYKVWNATKGRLALPHLITIEWND